MQITKLFFLVLITSLAFTACKKDTVAPTPKDPITTERISIDRFTAAAGTLMIRDGSNGLPAANAAINFDQGPFITQGHGPNGEIVWYYNFDIHPAAAEPIWVLFRTGETTPVVGQANIIDVVPGDAGYSDFWLVNKVTVPSDYVANTLTSKQEVLDSGDPIEQTTTIVNCPVVPEGSTASMRFLGGANALTQGWDKDKVVFYFNFDEAAITAGAGGSTPESPIYVTFNINPDQPGGGPPSGFIYEPGTLQTHNVLATLPGDAGYSPLWTVNIYDNADWANVMNLATAQSANILVSGPDAVNCPVAKVQ